MSTPVLFIEKVLCELIEPVDVRINALLEFLKDVKPGLDYRLVPIYEMLGPTITDDTMDLIVLSQETLKGGEIINKEREKVVSLFYLYVTTRVNQNNRELALVLVNFCHMYAINCPASEYAKYRLLLLSNQRM